MPFRQPDGINMIIWWRLHYSWELPSLFPLIPLYACVMSPSEVWMSHLNSFYALLISVWYPLMPPYIPLLRSLVADPRMCKRWSWYLSWDPITYLGHWWLYSHRFKITATTFALSLNSCTRACPWRSFYPFIIYPWCILDVSWYLFDASLTSIGTPVMPFWCCFGPSDALSDTPWCYFDAL